MAVFSGTSELIVLSVRSQEIDPNFNPVNVDERAITPESVQSLLDYLEPRRRCSPDVCSHVNVEPWIATTEVRCVWTNLLIVQA